MGIAYPSFEGAERVGSVVAVAGFKRKMDRLAMRFLERFCAPFNDVSYGENLHVRDLASLSNDSFRSPVSLSDVPFSLFFKCLKRFKKGFKCLDWLEHLLKRVQT